MRRAPLLPALVVALIVGCDGGAPVGPMRPVQLTSVDTLRPGQLAHVRGSGSLHNQTYRPAVSCE